MRIYEKSQWEEIQKFCTKDYRNLILKRIMDLLIDGLQRYGEPLIFDLLMRKGGYRIVAVAEIPAKEPERDIAPLKEESKPLKTRKQPGSSANRLHDHLKS